MANVQVVHAGASRNWSKRVGLVAVPLLPVQAGTPGERGDNVADFDQIRPQAILAAPKYWCPNPDSTISPHVKGNSMSPSILDGYIITVDTSDVSPDNLLGQIVVACNIDSELLVSRLIRIDHTDVLLPDDRE
jgi:phage repressor protein C with HTH and peptisase S24 domain